MPRPSVADKRRTFRELHESGCFVIPNPWDVGSARYLQGLGFKALASTSSGFAWSVAHADNAVGVDMVLAHLKEICAATDVPVNADFEGGYADDPAGVARNVTRCCETGVAGLSIEDSTGNKDKPLYDIPFAVERMKAARAAIDKAAPRRAAHRPRRGLHLRRARSRPDDRAAEGLRGRRAPTASMRRASARASRSRRW